MTQISYEDLATAFDFVSFGAPTEHRAYVSLDTGAIYWVSEAGDVEDEELPDDLEASDRYVEVPHKNELDLGTHLALRFVADQLPNRYEQVSDFFSRRGGYSRFKDLLTDEGRLDAWYAFEADSRKRALREWCAANRLALTDAS
jgi:hypothetical protein